MRPQSFVRSFGGTARRLEGPQGQQTWRTYGVLWLKILNWTVAGCINQRKKF